MQADTYIPRRLDDQWKIGFWDVDVAAPILFMFFVGYLSGSRLSFAVCMAMGIFVSRWISRLKADKELSFGEKQMLDQAKTLLICELAIARSAKEDKIRKEIEAIFTSN